MKNRVFDIYSDKLMKLVQNAHAGEIGAYHAYKWHAISTKNELEKNKINQIKLEELDHIKTCKNILNYYGYNTNKYKDTIMYIIGQSLGLLCFISGRKLANFGAMIIEKIGINSYAEMIDCASKLNNKKLVETFTKMHDVEVEHDLYFKDTLK